MKRCDLGEKKIVAAAAGRKLKLLRMVTGRLIHKGAWENKPHQQLAWKTKEDEFS